MSFHEVRFPASLSFGSVGGPERRTDIVTLANGFEERNTPWAHSRRRYDAGLGMRSLEDVERLIAFFEARQGQMYGFRWKDWADFKSAGSTAEVDFRDQVIAVGDGARTEFPLVKTYRSGGNAYVRPIAKPVAGTVRIGIEQEEARIKATRAARRRDGAKDELQRIGGGAMAGAGKAEPIIGNRAGPGGRGAEDLTGFFP